MWNDGAALEFFMLIIIGVTTMFSGNNKEAEGALI